MRNVIAAAAIVLLAGCSGDDHALRERAAYWRELLAEGVPAGTSQADAEAWGARHNVKFEYHARQRVLQAIAEHVAASSSSLQCSQWNVIVKVSLDRQGRSIGNDVSTGSACR